MLVVKFQIASLRMKTNEEKDMKKVLIILALTTLLGSCDPFRCSDRSGLDHVACAIEQELRSW